MRRIADDIAVGRIGEALGERRISGIGGGNELVQRVIAVVPGFGGVGRIGNGSDPPRRVEHVGIGGQQARGPGMGHLRQPAADIIIRSIRIFLVLRTICHLGLDQRNSIHSIR